MQAAVRSYFSSTYNPNSTHSICILVSQIAKLGLLFLLHSYTATGIRTCVSSVELRQEGGLRKDYWQSQPQPQRRLTTFCMTELPIELTRQQQPQQPLSVGYFFTNRLFELLLQMLLRAEIFFSEKLSLQRHFSWQLWVLKRWLPKWDHSSGRSKTEVPKEDNGLITISLSQPN